MYVRMYIVGGLHLNVILDLDTTESESFVTLLSFELNLVFVFLRESQ